MIFNSKSVISIVPRLPPAIDGVGDYALNLARQLRKDFNIQTRFIVGNQNWSGNTEIEGFPVSQVLDSSANTLLAQLSIAPLSPVLLHYVGYGYAQRGCPVWLIEGLQRWKSLYPQRSFVTMFHEVYGYGSPWTSSFWLLPLQKNLVSRLLKYSNQCITSNQDYVDRLTNLIDVKSDRIITMPVFSNIGEPKSVKPLVQRSKKIVIFGHKNSRAQVYQECMTALAAICELLNIEQIDDIGVPTGLELSTIANVPVVENGIIESQEISQILQDSIVGFLNFPLPTYLAKSTIFSTFCAHGVVPCMIASSPIPIDNIETDKHYWSYQKHSSQLNLQVGQEIADRAYKMYQSHKLSAQAALFARSLGANN
jgi:hypothetical protein